MSKATLSQIIAALPEGITAEPRSNTGDPDSFAWITNAVGDRFSLYLSDYRGKATATAANWDIDTVRANSSDIGSALRAGEASSSLDQDPAKIAASLTRRVFNNPDFIAEARAIRAVFDERTKSRAGLREGILALQAQGFRCGELRDGETVPMYKYHSVTLYKPGVPMVTLYGNGCVTFEATISTDVDGLQSALDTLAQLKA